MITDKKKRDSEEEGKSEKLPYRKDGKMEEEGDSEELKADKKKDAFADGDENRNAVAEVHSLAHHASSAWGNDTVKPFGFESADDYTRRSARWHQQHSQNWKDVDLKTLNGKALDVAARQIFSDSAAAS